MQVGEDLFSTPFKYKWYNSKGDYMYLSEKDFYLITIVHDYEDLPSEEGLITVKVIQSDEWKSLFLYEVP